MKFKIVGTKKHHLLKIGSLVEVFNSLSGYWESYTVTNIKLINNEDAEIFVIMSNKIGKSSKEVETLLCLESRIYYHIENNILRIKKP